VVKAHVQRLGRQGAQAAARHLRYIERDGVEKDGSPGVLYGPEGPVARETLEQPRIAERHQFRFIVSPEDAGDLDLAGYVRELMKRVETDLGRSIEWAAVNHHDTDHPHAHVVVRGVCREGRQLRMERAYIARGLRWTAQELATERLGPRLAQEIRRTRECEVHQERFTSLDREIERAAPERRVEAGSLAGHPRGPEPELLVRRLEQLERIGVAEKATPRGWVLAEDWQRRLRELGERGDILKQMHRALGGSDVERLHVVRPGQGIPDGRGGLEERTLAGRVVRKGLADELNGRSFYAVIETPQGDAYHFTLGARVADALRAGTLVSFGTKPEPAVQPVDRHIVEVAAARGGVYEVPGDVALGDVGQRAARRLRELERAGVVGSRGPTQWTVPSDLIARLEKRHREAPARHRLSVEAIPLGLDAQVGHRGRVWLDSVDTTRLAREGFGAEVRAAVERRHQVLRELGIEPDSARRGARASEPARGTVGGGTARPTGSDSPGVARGGPVADPQELARRAAGEALAREWRMTFLREVPERFAGRVQSGPAGSGYLAVSDGARFVLVPATPRAHALMGRTVEVARDAEGRFVRIRTQDLDRGR
jgi:type IV secretory pathway VirD2 relaxase